MGMTATIEATALRLNAKAAGAAALDGVENGGRRITAGVEDSRCANPVRKCEVVAEAVGVEETGGRVGGVALGDTEHLLAISDARVRDVVLEVHDGLRLPR